MCGPCNGGKAVLKLLSYLVIRLYFKSSKISEGTDKSLSEALIFASTNPQYDDRLFIVHENCKLRIPAEHVVYTNCCFVLFLHAEQFWYSTCSANVASF